MNAPVIMVYLPPRARPGEEPLPAELLIAGVSDSTVSIPVTSDSQTSELAAQSVYGKIVIAFDIPAKLKKSLLKRDVYLWDASEIGRILFPEADEFTAGGIAEHLGLDWPGENPVETAREMFSIYETTLEATPLAAVETVRAVLESLGGTLTDYFETAAQKLTAKGRAGKAGGLSAYKNLFGVKEARYAGPPKDSASSYYLEHDIIREFFADGSRLAKSLTPYEVRPGQVEMACLVADAMKEGKPLLVEAGTGVGKSLAYLLPAVAYSLSTGNRVVVATNTKTLQNQLIRKDVPVLADALGVPFRVAMLKGRNNYLCIRKFIRYLSRAAEMEDTERLALASVIPWALVTDSGDISENVAFLTLATPDNRLQVVSTHEDCMGRQCRNYRSCFLRRARAAAHGANVVVVNYALLMAAIGEEGDLVPPFDDAVLDEAHNIEDAATDAFSVLVARWRIKRFLKNVSGGGEGGLIGAFSSLVRANPLSEDTMKVVERLINEAWSHVSATESAYDAFFNTAAALVSKADGGQLRHSADARDPAVFDPLVTVKQVLIAAIAGVAQPLRQAIELVEPHIGKKRKKLLGDEDEFPIDEKPGWSEIINELNGHLDMAAELIHDIDFVVTANEKGYVYWLEAVGDNVELWATPVDVSGMIFENFFLKKRSLIFTSATLTVSERFDFFLARSGVGLMGNAESHVVPSPFDYTTQSRLLVPTFLPEPGEPEFVGTFGKMVEGAVHASEGRAMVLFTSHKMLADVSSELRPRLEAEGFEVLQQEVDGPKDALLGRLRRNHRSVLFGTASFWEGVDVKGESLSLLILAKLPFPVHTEPLTAARQEAEERRGTDPFNGYLLPIAVLKLRQGFGRLIRSRYDRGIVIVADKRLLTRRYGGTFLRSLPAPHRPVTRPEDLDQIISRFFNSAGRPGESEVYFDEQIDADPYDIWGV
jgi:predicted DnaQ family exonuclease/DinG family helicase